MGNRVSMTVAGKNQVPESLATGRGGRLTNPRIAGVRGARERGRDAGLAVVNIPLLEMSHTHRLATSMRPIL